MKKEEVVHHIKTFNPFLAEAINQIVDYIKERTPAAFPNKEQTMAVNAYLKSIHADGDGSMSETNCEHRRIASRSITINAIRILTNEELNRLQDVLDHIAYDKEYYMPEQKRYRRM